MTTQHTPGPWEIAYDGPSMEIIIGSGRIIALIRPQPVHGDDEANARLIAAAPTLLAALDKFLVATEKTLEEGKADWLDAVCDAREAIAKAKGEDR